MRYEWADRRGPIIKGLESDVCLRQTTSVPWSKGLLSTTKSTVAMNYLNSFVMEMFTALVWGYLIS